MLVFCASACTQDVSYWSTATRVERAASPAMSAMGVTAQQYSNYENGYPLPRDPAIVLVTVWIGTASSQMQLRRREGSRPSQ